MNTRDVLIRVSDEEIARRLADPGEPDLGALSYESGRRRLRLAASALVALLDSPDLDVRLGALEALGEVGDERAGTRILLLLDDERAERSIRDTAAWTLGLLRYAPAVHKLAELLSAPEATVRSCAAAALVAVGDKTALPAVQYQLAVERVESVARDLRAAVEKLRPTVLPERDAARSQVSRSAVEALPNPPYSPQSGLPPRLGHG